VKTLLAADADVHAQDDWALRWATCNGYTETVKVLLEAIKSQNAQRLELERQLLGGTGLMVAESRPEDVEVLLRDAIAEQSGISSLAAEKSALRCTQPRALAQPGGVSALAPASARSFPLCFAQLGGAQPERPDGRDHVPLPLCP
jgi:hypothetical protein